MADMLRSNPGFVVTDSSVVTFGGQLAKVYSFVGQNQNIPEPEKTTFIILSGKRYRLTIELVSPTSKLHFYNDVYRALVTTFKLSEYFTSK